MTSFAAYRTSEGQQRKQQHSTQHRARRTARITSSVRRANTDEETASKLDALFAKLASESAATDAQTPTPSPVRTASNRPEGNVHGRNTNRPISLNLGFLANAPVANVDGANTNQPTIVLNLGDLADIPIANVDDAKTDQPLLDLSFLSVTDAPVANVDGTNTDQPSDLRLASPTDPPVANLGGADTDQPVFDTSFNIPSESDQASPVSTVTVSTELNQTLDLSVFGDSTGLFVNSTEDFANLIGLSSFAGDDAFKALILNALFSLMMLDDFMAAELEEDEWHQCYNGSRRDVERNSFDCESSQRSRVCTCHSMVVGALRFVHCCGDGWEIEGQREDFAAYCTIYDAIALSLDHGVNRSGNYHVSLCDRQCW
ncbi:hypothetical protein MHU86_21254 [Fragilaria crotonensis]|nr:hypothetical protein MHU86_21254 [Fragilaria crotonensis]